MEMFPELPDGFAHLREVEIDGLAVMGQADTLVQKLRVDFCDHGIAERSGPPLYSDTRQDIRCP